MTTTEKPATPTQTTVPATQAAATVNKVTAKAAPKAVAPKAVAKPIAKPIAKVVTKVVTKVVKKPAAKPVAKAKTTVAPAVKAKPAAKPVAAKPVKVKKPKMVRDSLTMPKPEYAVLDALKLRGAKLASPVKKTELIRAGIKALAAMSDAAFLSAIKAVPSLKTGRPANAKAA
jgi:hypothetical protein